ncbi:phenoloxidase-activating factor 2 [Drosophila eugracilis]|uniref:phenoloxidase-activating factor 2 n=1 Tax=Drosophila eugracilis TaxID=29029 RepID=UPI001BDA37EA|nr:phenoloxidase-activating factor 2 [Drosophila eugracilis]
MFHTWILLLVTIIYVVAENVQNIPDSEDELDALDEQPKCGQGSPIPLKLDLNITADQARPAEYPWTIAIIHNDSFIGGGSLIAPDVVLTSAHRIYDKNPEDIIVSAGEWQYGKALDKYPFEEASVSKMVVHESFNYKNGTNNLALLFLDSQYQLTYRINTICLPIKKRSLNNTRCIVAGWGKNRFRDKHFVNVLKKIELPIVPRDTCQDQLRETKFGKNYTLPAGLICAGGEEGIDACTGDGGGALFCPMTEDPKQFEQIGIVNWGLGCKKKNIPGTYTDVFEFKPWIDKQIGSNFFLPQKS